MNSSNTLGYLDRFLDPVTEAFSPEVAQRLLDLRAQPDVAAQLNVLRRKANAGTLTPDEQAEYQAFVEAVDVLSILQSKARRFLPRQAD